MLSYDDVQKYVKDYETDQKQLSFDKKYNEFQFQHHRNRLPRKGIDKTFSKDEDIDLFLGVSDKSPQTQSKFQGKKNDNSLTRHSTIVMKNFDFRKVIQKVNENIQSEYVPTLPESIQVNKFKVNPQYYEDFKKSYSNAKKQMELDILKRNKKLEVINAITKLCDSYKDSESSLKRKTLDVYERFKARQERVEINRMGFMDPIYEDCNHEVQNKSLETNRRSMQ